MSVPDTIEGSVRTLETSFIIKAHALIEAAVSHLLCGALGKTALAEVFSHLELSDKRRGKIEFAAALDLLGKPDRRFISADAASWRVGLGRGGGPPDPA